MGKINQDYDQCKVLFQEHQDKEQAQAMAAYMKHRFVFYGIATPLRKKLSKEIWKEKKKTNNIDWNFVMQCYQDEHREFHYLAIDYLHQMRKHLTWDDVLNLETLARTNQWWDSIDMLDTLIGEIDDERIKDLMRSWAKDDDVWLRRIAIDHQLLRKEKTDTELFQEILLDNIEIKEFFVEKAIGWSLREYSKVNSKWVSDFIQTYGDRMSKLSIREGSKYL